MTRASKYKFDKRSKFKSKPSAPKPKKIGLIQAECKEYETTNGISKKKIRFKERVKKEVNKGVKLRITPEIEEWLRSRGYE